MGVGYPTPRAGYPGVTGGPPIPLLALAPGEACRAIGSPRCWWALTPPFHPCPCGRSEVSMALSAVRTARALPGTLPYGVRTFLGSTNGNRDPPLLSIRIIYHTGRPVEGISPFSTFFANSYNHSSGLKIRTFFVEKGSLIATPSPLGFKITILFLRISFLRCSIS